MDAYDTACKLRGSQKVSLFCARNSSAAFQILIEEEKKINVMLTSPAVDNISIDIYNILPVYVEKNTGEKGYTAGPYDSLDHVLRKVPFVFMMRLSRMNRMHHPNIVLKADMFLYML